MKSKGFLSVVVFFAAVFFTYGEANGQVVDAVKDAAVVGVASKQWGETPVAFVELKPGRTETGEQIRAWANERLGKTQRLSALEIMETLPRSAIGKVLKRELREQYAAAARP